MIDKCHFDRNGEIFLVGMTFFLSLLFAI